MHIPAFTDAVQILVCFYLSLIQPISSLYSPFSPPAWAMLFSFDFSPITIIPVNTTEDKLVQQRTIEPTLHTGNVRPSLKWPVLCFYVCFERLCAHESRHMCLSLYRLIDKYNVDIYLTVGLWLYYLQHRVD